MICQVSISLGLSFLGRAFACFFWKLFYGAGHHLGDLLINIYGSGCFNVVQQSAMRAPMTQARGVERRSPIACSLILIRQKA